MKIIIKNKFSIIGVVSPLNIKFAVFTIDGEALLLMRLIQIAH